MKHCSKCDLDKIEEDFLVRDKQSGRRGTICKECRAKYHIAWHHKTKENRVEQKRKWRKITRQKRVDLVSEYLQAHPCVDCGESDIRVLDFDHLGDKKQNVSNMLNGSSFESIIAEIAKCEVRCANCHRRKTAERAGWNFKLNFLNTA